MNKLIVFEGGDGSGKSVISKKVAESTNSLFIESPLDEFQKTRRYVNEHTPEKGQFLFYMSTNLDLSQKFEDELPNNNIVCARYYFSTLIDYSSRWDVPIYNLMDKLPINNSDFRQPDLTILLYVNEEVQKQRINERNNGVNTHSDELCLKNEVYQKELSDKYLRVAERNNWVIVDNSYQTIDDSVNESIVHVNKILNGGA